MAKRPEMKPGNNWLRLPDPGASQVSARAQHSADYTALPQDLLHSIVALLLEDAGGLQALQHLRLTCKTWRTALQQMPGLSISPRSLATNTIKLFPSLTGLDLVARRGSHRLDPACLFLLPTLKQLRSLRFNGGFEDWVGLAAAQAALCPALTSLRIEGAKLAGMTAFKVLQSIGSMRWLRDLALTDVGKLDMPIVPHLTACVALHSLDLQGASCLTTEEVGLMSRHFSQLQFLNLSRCSLIDVGPLASLHQLQEVRLAGCLAVSDEGLAAFLLGAGASLTSLCLSDCHRLTAQGLGCLPRAQGLEVLDVSHLSRSATPTMPWLGQLPHLKQLMLSDNHMTRPAMRSLIAAQSSLTALTKPKLCAHCWHGRMEDAWVPQLASFASLRALGPHGLAPPV
eukprot:jgi/Botrbrau1/870/Bobra.0352s0059.1